MFEYVPSDIVVTWGSTTFVDFSDGSYVVGERAEDLVMPHVGARGTVTATMNENQMGSVTIQLVQGTPTNVELMAVVEQMERTKKIVRRELTITDLAGSVLAQAPSAWIRKPMRIEFAKEHVGREWIFDCDKLLYLAPTAIR